MARVWQDPSDLEGEELDRWYRRSPEEIEAERRATHDAAYSDFFGGSEAPLGMRSGDDPGGWQEAKFRPPPRAAATPRSPIGPVARDSVAGAPGPNGYFGSRSPRPGGLYVDPSVPAPLDRVQHDVGNIYVLHDNTRVTADEVERLYAEQKRRARGEDEAPPLPRVQVVDRYKDGTIPKADQLLKNERELDPTCHPNGGWERDPQFPTYSERTQRYETQIARAPGLDYVVRVPGEGPVKFDGCAVWSPARQLLEAKGPGYDGLFEDFPWTWAKVRTGPVRQADRQRTAARGRPIEWHVAEPRARETFDTLIRGEPPIHVKHTPPRIRAW